MFSSSASNTPSRFKMIDVWIQVGARLHTEAVHIRSCAHCRRWYGQLAQTKIVSGTEEKEVVPSEFNSYVTL